MDYKELINSKPLGSKERLALIVNYGNAKASNAALRCIQKRDRRSYLIDVCKMPIIVAFKIVDEEWNDKT